MLASAEFSLGLTTAVLWLNQRDLYGDLGEDPRFAETFSRQLRLIWNDGTEAALRAYLNA